LYSVYIYVFWLIIGEYNIIGGSLEKTFGPKNNRKILKENF